VADTQFCSACVNCQDRCQHRTAQTTTAGHVIGEQGQQTKHTGESLMDKAAHAVGIKK
jgi:ferredoxin